ncbi:MAG: type I-E CRISPR-associated endoribonuclease Cas2e [Candidatus Nanoarchaeia archaeon]|jgi:CRISPR-associated protein Cas2|nr:type I-E CRISPR-associated endoribonuclease Cas2e [Candidatus Nanoarchaeia archaeon]
MIVVIADFLHPAIRGRMKLWFVEIRPNVFVSGVTDSIAEHVVDYLYKSCVSTKSSFTIFQKINKSPGYKIRWLNSPKKNIIEISGLQLVQEK